MHLIASPRTNFLFHDWILHNNARIIIWFLFIVYIFYVTSRVHSFQLDIPNLHMNKRICGTIRQRLIFYRTGCPWSTDIFNAGAGIKYGKNQSSCYSMINTLKRKKSRLLSNCAPKQDRLRILRNSTVWAAWRSMRGRSSCSVRSVHVLYPYTFLVI